MRIRRRDFLSSLCAGNDFRGTLLLEFGALGFLFVVRLIGAGITTVAPKLVDCVVAQPGLYVDAGCWSTEDHWHVGLYGCGIVGS